MISDLFYDLGLDDYLEYTASLKVSRKQSDEPQNEDKQSMPSHEVHVESDENGDENRDEDRDKYEDKVEELRKINYLNFLTILN